MTGRVTWKVWYDGQAPSGDRYDNRDGPAEAAPAFGVLAIVQADPDNGRYVLAADPYFWWEYGRWWSGDLFGCWDYLARPGCRKVLFGRQVPNDHYQRILRAAEEDPEFTARTARRPGEPQLSGGGP